MSNSDPSTYYCHPRNKSDSGTAASWDLLYCAATCSLQLTNFTSSLAGQSPLFLPRQTTADSILPTSLLALPTSQIFARLGSLHNDTEDTTVSAGATASATPAIMQAENSGQAATQSQSAPKSRPRRPRGSRRGGRGGAANVSDSLEFRPASVAPPSQTAPSNRTAPSNQTVSTPSEAPTSEGAPRGRARRGGRGRGGARGNQPDRRTADGRQFGGQLTQADSSQASLQAAAAEFVPGQQAGQKQNPGSRATKAAKAAEEAHVKVASSRHRHPDPRGHRQWSLRMSHLYQRGSKELQGLGLSHMLDRLSLDMH